MPNESLQPQRCAELLSALAAPERLGIVRLLADGERNVTQITERLNIPPLNIAHHLTVLKSAGLIRSEKRGRFVWYTLYPGVLAEAVEAGIPKEVLNLGCCRIEFSPDDGTRAKRRGDRCELSEGTSEPEAPNDCRA